MMQRFKTREEFIEEYGANWARAIKHGWSYAGLMDYLFGMPYDPSGKMWDIWKPQVWKISPEMLTDKPFAEISQEVKLNYSRAGIKIAARFLPSWYWTKQEEFLKKYPLAPGESFIDWNHISTYRYRLMKKEEFQKKYPASVILDHPDGLFSVIIPGKVSFASSMSRLCGKYLTQKQWDDRRFLSEKGESFQFSEKPWAGWQWIPEWFVKESWVDPADYHPISSADFHPRVFPPEMEPLPEKGPRIDQMLMDVTVNIKTDVEVRLKF